MSNKDKRKPKRVNIKKERQKLIKEKRKSHPEQEINIDKKSS